MENGNLQRSIFERAHLKRRNLFRIGRKISREMTYTDSSFVKSCLIYFYEFCPMTVFFTKIRTKPKTENGKMMSCKIHAWHEKTEISLFDDWRRHAVGVWTKNKMSDIEANTYTSIENPPIIDGSDGNIIIIATTTTTPRRQYGNNESAWKVCLLWLILYLYFLYFS